MRLSDPERPYILETNGSPVAVGALLKQRFDDTSFDKPVGFFSRDLTGSERNYAAYEVELDAVVRAVEYFRMFLLGKKFLLRTDYAAFRNLLQRDLPSTTRVKPWILSLSEYNSRLNIREARKTSSQMSSLASLSPARKTPRGPASSTMFFEK